MRYSTKQTVNRLMRSPKLLWSLSHVTLRVRGFSAPRLLHWQVRGWPNTDTAWIPPHYLRPSSLSHSSLVIRPTLDYSDLGKVVAQKGFLKKSGKCYRYRFLQCHLHSMCLMLTLNLFHTPWKRPQPKPDVLCVLLITCNFVWSAAVIPTDRLNFGSPLQHMQRAAVSRRCMHNGQW